MPKKAKLEAAVLKARADWRRVCNDHASTSDDRRRVFAGWKRAESELTRALLLWKSLRAERRKAAADRRRANADLDWLKTNVDRRKQVRRP
jgi:hypothetical protein